jgi:hypothetical protein
MECPYEMVDDWAMGSLAGGLANEPRAALGHWLLDRNLAYLIELAEERSAANGSLPVRILA